MFSKIVQMLSKGSGKMQDVRDNIIIHSPVYDKTDKKSLFYTPGHKHWVCIFSLTMNAI